MDAKELRIGNLINVGGCTIDTYQTYTPCVVNIGMLKQIQEENKERPDAILSVWQPIPLTEEWLLKLGFEKGTDLFEDYPEYEKQFDIGKSITINHEFECYQGIYSQKIQYVHQLQNLYFALTGQELEITKA